MLRLNNANASNIVPFCATMTAFAANSQARHRDSGTPAFDPDPVTSANLSGNVGGNLIVISIPASSILYVAVNSDLVVRIVISSNKELFAVDKAENSFAVTRGL